MRTFQEVVTEMPLLPYIREAGYAIRKPWILPERRLLDYLLIYVQEGILEVQCHGTKLTFTEGEFCLLQPEDLHTLEGKTKTITPYVHLDLFYHEQRERSFPTRPGQIDLHSFSELIQPRLNDMSGINIPLRLLPSHPIVFKETLLRMIGLWLEGDLLHQLEAQHLANGLVLSILKDIPDFQWSKYQKPQSLNWIPSYFSFHLSEPLSLADMAKRAQLSLSRFAAVFKKQFGMPPHQYLLQHRVRHAQELLCGNTYSLQEIAGYCGFADIHHFAKAFKKATGETPGAYRSRNWEP